MHSVTISVKKKLVPFKGWGRADLVPYEIRCFFCTLTLVLKALSVFVQGLTLIYRNKPICTEVSVPPPPPSIP